MGDGAPWKNSNGNRLFWSKSHEESWFGYGCKCGSLLQISSAPYVFRNTWDDLPWLSPAETVNRSGKAISVFQQINFRDCAIVGLWKPKKVILALFQYFSYILDAIIHVNPSRTYVCLYNITNKVLVKSFCMKFIINFIKINIIHYIN